jgi:hypothetical protein
VPENPISISTLPISAEIDYAKKGGHFGPHNLHENRPGSFVSETLIFATRRRLTPHPAFNGIATFEPCTLPGSTPLIANFQVLT